MVAGHTARLPPTDTRLLYAREGLDCIGDPYDIGLDPRHRPWIKHALNALINAGQGGIAVPEDYHQAQVGLPHKELAEVSQCHASISRYFYGGVGVELQFVDSCIAERVMLILADRHIVCLPVHDSFLVQKQHERILIEAMLVAYREIVGKRLSGDLPEKLIEVKRPKIIAALVNKQISSGQRFQACICEPMH